MLEDGTEIVGETNIDIPKHDGNLRITKVFLDPLATIYEETEKAIREADLIVIGPERFVLFSHSDTCCFWDEEVLSQQARQKSRDLQFNDKVGETHGFAASDMIKNSCTTVAFTFDYVICNTQKMNPRIAAAYEREKSTPWSAMKPYIDMRKR